MRLTDIKIPNFKFPKIKMKGIENLQELKVNVEELDRKRDIHKLIIKL